MPPSGDGLAEQLMAYRCGCGPRLAGFFTTTLGGTQAADGGEVRGRSTGACAAVRRPQWSDIRDRIHRELALSGLDITADYHCLPSFVCAANDLVALLILDHEAHISHPSAITTADVRAESDCVGSQQVVTAQSDHRSDEGHLWLRLTGTQRGRGCREHGDCILGNDI